MYSEFFTSLLNKIFTREVAIATFLASVFILIAPEEWITKMGLSAIAEDYAIVVSALALCSGSVLATKLITSIADCLAQAVTNYRAERSQKKNLDGLTPEEKKVLRLFVSEEKSSIEGSINDGTFCLLEKKTIISRTSNRAISRHTFAWVLQPWARKELKRDPERYLGEK